MKYLTFAFCTSLLNGLAITTLKAQESTALPNVLILKNAIDVPYSVSARSLRVYLPENYEKSESHYPVIYMLDGQNLYDTVTAYAGEWGIDESMQTLESIQEAIIVGIDNHGVFRMQEYNPHPTERFGAPQGRVFGELMVNAIKPYIDQHFRTLSDRQNTAIIGSSMGGLMAYYMIMAYPETFSMAGVYSPSFWVSDDIYKMHEKNQYLDQISIHMIVGSEEGGMVEVYQKMDSILVKKIPAISYRSEIVANQRHNESFWREMFPETFRTFFGSSTSDQ